MKKLVFAIICVVTSAVLLAVVIPKKNKPIVKEQEKKLPSQTPSIQLKGSYKKMKSVFVPYWGMDGKKLDITEYDRVYYFGVTVDGNSNVAHETGFQKLDTFVSSIPQDKQTYLVLRMTDSEVNSTILSRPEDWQELVRETINIVKKYKFNGLALDLESSNILDSGMIDKMNRFVELFSTEAKKGNVSFSFILYGDVYYRKRPFDVSFISSHSDEVLVMAYDFHKSYGEPGPNFPLEGKTTYGYDFKMMIDDFLKIIPPEKFTVIFGMYGYDWGVDEKKRPLKPAGALTLNEIRKSFIEACGWKDCIVKRDEMSGETEVNYVESVKSGDEYRMNLHVVWFEDEESVRRKTEYLNSKGIGSVAYWAYGYF